MNTRDKAIIQNLQKFRVLDRDQLISLHFVNLKRPVNACNDVMKRLRRDKHIEADTSANPFNYFPVPSIRKDSAKLNHFKAIANFYIDLWTVSKPSVFEVEWKTGDKGSIEPDVFMIWKGTPFFVEIQRNVYSKKVMNDKYERYSKYFYSDEWKEEPWQRKDKKFFPYVWMITEQKYKFPNEPVKVFQTQNANEFINRHMKKG